MAKILIACEYSGRTRTEFEKRFPHHEVWSADLRSSLIPSPRHYQGDVRNILGENWDLLIGHPPCTRVASSGARWMEGSKNFWDQQDAHNFFRLLRDAPIFRIALENPVGTLSTWVGKPTQIVHPFWFGDPFRKRTCLWLKNLPKLVPTNMVEEGKQVIHGGKKIPAWYSNREFDRNLTFPGMAAAFATQWGGLL